MSKTAVIFDVDGVLVDSYQAHFQSWQQMLGEKDVEFSESQFRATFGRTSRDIIAELYSGKLTDTEIAELDNRKEALFRDLLQQNFLAIEGATDLVEALANAGLKLAVGSSAPAENVAVTLKCLGCEDLFTARVSGGDVTRGKPDPQVFLLGAERLGVAAEQCVVVEDAPAGVEAANSAGMTSIALTGTATRDELAHADLVVESLCELSPEQIRGL